MDIQCNNCQAYLNIREVVTRCTECKELLKPKTKNMKNNFKVKDRVFHIHYGWGNIVIVHNENSVDVEFDNSFGLCLIDCKLLSFTKYTLQGFTQERPFTPEVGEYYFFYDEYMLRDETLIYSKLSQIIDNTTYVTTAGGYFEKISETNPLL